MISGLDIIKGYLTGQELLNAECEVERLTGDARWLYEHEIKPVKKLRYSIVLRNC